MKYASGYVGVSMNFSGKFNAGDIKDYKVSFSLSFTPKYVFCTIIGISGRKSSTGTSGGVSNGLISNINNPEYYGNGCGIKATNINISSSGFTTRFTVDDTGYYNVSGAIMNNWYAIG